MDSGRLWIGLSELCTRTLPFLTIFVALRSSPEEVLAKYNLIMLFVALTQAFLMPALDTYFAKEVAQSGVQNSFRTIRRVLQIYGTIGAVSIVFLALTATYGRITGPEREALIGVSVGVGLSAQMVATSLYLGSNQYTAVFITSGLTAIILTIHALLVPLGFSYSLDQRFSFQVLLCICVTVLVYWYHQKLPVNTQYDPTDDYQNVQSFYVPSLLNSLLNFLRQYSFNMALLFYFNAGIIAGYTKAWAIVGVLLASVNLINKVLFTQHIQALSIGKYISTELMVVTTFAVCGFGYYVLSIQDSSSLLVVALGLSEVSVDFLKVLALCAFLYPMQVLLTNEYYYSRRQSSLLGFNLLAFGVQVLILVVFHENAIAMAWSMVAGSLVYTLMTLARRKSA